MEQSDTAYRETLCLEHLSYLQHPAVAVKLTVSHRQIHCVVTPQESRSGSERAGTRP